MKITAICASSGKDFGLNAAFKTVCDTLVELGEEIAAINLAETALPYYNGQADAACDIMEAVKGCDGLVFACSAVFHAPSALMHTFLEYFQNSRYQNLLKQKKCLLLTISKDGGERVAAEQLSRILGSLGAIDVVRISLNATADVTDDHVTELTERQTEDFYRILRQNRKYILPQNNPAGSDRKTADIEGLYKKHNLDNINKAAQDDINKIAAVFARKFGGSDESATGGEITPRVKGETCKQLTASLPQYFIARQAKDFNAVIQLNISGDDGFLGHLAISERDCTFNEGDAEKSDIIVIAEAKAWTDVLKKNTTAQKAFMMGKLKVRGNFVLLTKFDQLFDKVQ